MKQNLILSSSIDPSSVLNGTIDHTIRVSHKNKWIPGTIFSVDIGERIIADVVICSSELYNIKEIPISILARCGYSNLESLQSKTRDLEMVWLIRFSIITSIPETETIPVNDLLYS